MRRANDIENKFHHLRYQDRIIKHGVFNSVFTDTENWHAFLNLNVKNQHQNVYDEYLNRKMLIKFKIRGPFFKTCLSRLIKLQAKILASHTNVLIQEQLKNYFARTFIPEWLMRYLKKDFLIPA